MEDRITELEIRFMQHEHTIHELNDTVVRQELAIERLQRELSLLREQIVTIDPSSSREPDEDERPPHY